MRLRRESGATLALVSSCLGVLVMLGFCFFLIAKLVGGGRELQNAVDAGNLNVAKKTAKNVGVSLQGSVELANFSGLVDKDTGKMNLLSYNRAVGQALLVAANAQEIGRDEAKKRAKQVLDAAQSGKGSVGERLLAELEQTGFAERYFNEMAGRNSLRMLNSGNPQYLGERYDLGFLNRHSENNQSAATNVSINPVQFPALKAFLSNVPDPKNPGSFFLRGYNDIEFDFGSGFGKVKIQGVTLNPGQGPHLVAASLFESGTKSPYSGKTGAVPPNAFKTAARIAVSNNSSQTVTSEAASVVGALDATFQASLPSGYVKIINPPGINYGGAQSTSVNNPLNNELFAGVYLANNDAFSTDEALLQKWVQYNTAPTPKPPRPSGEGIFDRHGNNASAAVLESITAPGEPCSKCTYLNVSGPGEIAKCKELYDSFIRAYGYTTETNLGAEQLLSVEKAKADLIDAYFTSWSVDGRCRQVGAPPGTGLRKFDHNAVYVCAPQGSPWNPNWTRNSGLINEDSVQFSKPSTIREYLKQVKLDRKGRDVEKEVLAVLRGRLNQIKPGLSDAEFNSIVDMTETSERLELGTTFYIYLKNGKLVITQVPPNSLDPNVNLKVTPDGTPDLFESAPYDLVPLCVNPVHEIGIHYMLFTQWHPCNPNAGPEAGLKGVDSTTWTPSSGFENFLGQLEFGNAVKGCTEFCAPN